MGEDFTVTEVDTNEIKNVDLIIDFKLVASESLRTVSPVKQ
jgi:hypothetical protein